MAQTERQTWPSFVDAQGNAWTIEITSSHIKTLRNAPDLKVDLLSIFEKGNTTLEQLASNEILLVDVISMLLTDEIKKRGMDAESFARCIFGDAIDRATDALIEAIGFFSPSHRRQVITSLWRQQKGLRNLAVQKIEHIAPTLADRIGEKMDQKLNEAIDQVLGPSGT